MTYEVFLQVVDGDAQPVSPSVFQAAFEQLAEQLGFVESWPVYQSVGVEDELVVDTEYLRLQLDVPNASDNHVWMHDWRVTQEGEFGSSLWMIRYRAV